MKANFILGKKQIVLASLVLILGAAVYLNWQFANTNGDLELANKLEAQSDLQTGASAEDPISKAADTEGEDLETGAPVTSGKEAAPTAADPTGEVTDTKEDTQKTKLLGDAQLVSSKSIVDETYFASAKLARTKSRDEAIQTISTLLNNEQLTETDKKDASAKAMALTDMIEAESRIENLIKAKGFEECVVYITSANANVVVKTDGLDQDQATQIKNIVVSEGKIKGENISITEIR